MKYNKKFRILFAMFFITIALSVFVIADIYYSAGPSITCLIPSSGSAQSGISSQTLLSDGIHRCYLLFVPTGYDPTRKYPVVFALHGFAGNGSGLRQIAVWEPVAEKEKFIVVYPDGSSFPLRWNIGPIANIPTIDDVQFIRDVIIHLSSIANVDKERIFVTGFSNGGQMTHRIACNLTDQIAAVGIVEGFDSGMLDACTPSRPISIMAFWGKSDPLAGARYPKWFQKLINVTIDDNESTLPANAIDKWMENWAERDGCNMNYIEIPSIGNVNGIRYQECHDGTEVLLYLIEGQGHGWPGGPSLPLLGHSGSEINASETLWDFFKHHPLNGSSLL